MTYYEACTQLAKNIINGDYWDNGNAIQMFNSALADNETPRMSLSIVNENMKNPNNEESPLELKCRKHKQKLDTEMANKMLGR